MLYCLLALSHLSLITTLETKYLLSPVFREGNRLVTEDGSITSPSHTLSGQVQIFEILSQVS